MAYAISVTSSRPIPYPWPLTHQISTSKLRSGKNWIEIQAKKGADDDDNDNDNVTMMWLKQ